MSKRRLPYAPTDTTPAHGQPARVASNPVVLPALASTVQRMVRRGQRFTIRNADLRPRG